jgi:hypothetical protein
MALDSIEELENLICWWSDLLDGSCSENEELKLEPFSLLLCQEVRPAKLVLLNIECTHDDADEEVNEEKVANNQEEDKEQAPKNASLV